MLDKAGFEYVPLSPGKAMQFAMDMQFRSIQQGNVMDIFRRREKDGKTSMVIFVLPAYRTERAEFYHPPDFVSEVTTLDQYRRSPNETPMICDVLGTLRGMPKLEIVAPVSVPA